MDVGHLTPELALVIGAVAVVLTASFAPRRRQGITVPLALVAVAASAALSLVLATGAEQQLSFERAWALDGVTHGAELLIAAITAWCLVLAVEWFEHDARRGELPAVVLLGAAGAMLLAGAADTMELVVAMLLVSVTGYTLAAYHRGSPAAVEAGMRYFLVGAITNTVLLFGVTILYGISGTTNLADVADALAGGAGSRAAYVAVVVCVLVGLAFEIGAVPAHVWLPDVAQGSPAPMAAFLTVVPKIGAVVALARFVDVVPADLVAWRPLVAVVAVATMTLGNVVALRQDDVRRLLGWSSVSQAGYALVPIVVLGATDQAVPALVMFLVGYAVAQVAAFSVVVELRGRTALADYRGLARSRPVLAGVLVLALLSLVGVPPLAGFVGKLTVFSAAIDGGYTWLAVVAVANTVVSLAYYLRIVAPMYFDDHGAAAGARPVPVLGRWAGGAAGLAAEPILAALDAARLLP